MNRCIAADAKSAKRARRYKNFIPNFIFRLDDIILRVYRIRTLVPVIPIYISLGYREVIWNTGIGEAGCV